MNMHSDLALEYRHLEEVSSTNDFLRAYEPMADVTVLSASYQTKGRGQMGNTWISNSGENALFSILVCPSALKASDGFVLSQAMALSIKEVLDGYLEGISIKWPNDIYCGDEKICGTLIENVLMGKFVGRSVIGSGINVNQTISVTFAIGSALAAVAGVLLCTAYPALTPTTGSMPGIKAFTAAVFGGIGSIPGAMLGGILLGVIEQMSKAYISTQLSDAIVFAVLIIVLLVKPTGLLGKKIREKV